MSEITLHDALDSLALKFKSGNSVPVDRATITKEEISVIADKLFDLQVLVIDLQEELSMLKETL